MCWPNADALDPDVVVTTWVFGYGTDLVTVDAVG